MQLRSIIYCIVLSAGSFLCGSPSFAETPSLSTLEELVEQWVMLRSQRTEEQQAWERQQQQWQQEIKLLQEESRQLDETILRAEQFEADKESRASDQLALMGKLETALSEVGRVVELTAAEIAQHQIPPSLCSKELSRTLDELKAPAERLEPARRLQLLVGVLAEIDDLHAHTHVVRELLDLGHGQTRREMDVVYLGLACAYAVSTDNTFAAVGRPAESGWKWTANPSIAKTVRKLVRIQKKEEPPAIVALPLQGIPPEVQP